MDTVRKALHRMRAGFVLPMSLVVTVITMMFVAASATYCTTQLRTSQQYMSRTRCRLVAQSAIELTKLSLMQKCAGGDLAAVNLNGLTVANIDAYLPAVLAETKQDDFVRRIPGTGPEMAVAVDIKPGTGAQAGVYYIFATAEHRQGSRVATVTLREGIKVPISSSSIFDYAYFANHDGHLTSQYMVINGDVRANRDFYITGAEINGYVYASNTVHLATAKNGWGWRDDEDPCIRSMDSYNSMYRKNSQKEFSTYAKARPTNPLSSRGKQEWVGGFEAPDPVTTTTSISGILGWLIGRRTFETTTDTPDLDTDQLTPSKTVPDSKEDYIVNALALHDDDTHYFWWRSYKLPGKELNRSPGYLKIPQIEWSDSGDYGLQYYKNRAANCTTIKGRTGGSLICSNCFINAEGKIEQLSAKLKMNWTPTVDSEELEKEAESAREDFREDHQLSDYLTDSESKKDIYNDEVQTEDRTITDAKELADRAAEIVPEGGVLVYQCISASDWQRLSSSEKAKWRQMNGDHADAKDGMIGQYYSGYVGKIPAGEPHAGSQLFFDTGSFANAVKKFGTNADKLETKFADDNWKAHAADYDLRQVVDKVTYTDLGDETITPVDGKTQYVNLYSYSKTQPTKRQYRNGRWQDVPDDSWQALNSGYSRNPTTYFYSGEICFRGDDMSASDLYDAWRYSVMNLPRDIANDAVNFYKGGRNGWTSTTSGYSDKGDKNTKVAGYIAFDLMKRTWKGSTSYEVEANEIEVKPKYGGTVAKSRTIPHTQTNTIYKTVYTYNEYYYSQYPVGYVELSTPEVEVDLPTIKLVYTPFELDDPSFKEITKLVETKYLEMHKYLGRDRIGSYEELSDSSGHIQKGYSYKPEGSANDWMVAETGSRKNELTLDDLADYCEGVYDIDESTVKGEFTKPGSDWTARASSRWYTYYYNKGVDGYLAARIYGVFKGEKAVRYEVRYEILSKEEKTADEEKTPDTDVVQVEYVPLHTYATSFMDGYYERGMTSIGSSSFGYCNVTSGRFNHQFVKASELESVISALDGSYGLTSKQIEDYFENKTDGWNRPEKNILNYGYYLESASGYLTIKVIIDRKTAGEPTYRLEYGYSDTNDGTSSAGGISTTGVSGSDIPVYGHITKTEWSSKSYQEKANWVAMPSGAWRMNVDSESELSGCVFKESVIETVAQDRARETKNNYGVNVAEAVRDLFKEGGDAYEDGWSSSASGGYVTCVPIGRLHVSVEPATTKGTEIQAKYEYLSVSAGDVAETKVWQPGEKVIGTDPDYYRTHMDDLDEGTRSSVQTRYDAAMESYVEGRKIRYRELHSQPQTEATRELRRIFVRGGNKIDTTPQLHSGTGEADLILTRNDSGNVVDRLNGGSTTADLRPFREDGAHCNYKTEHDIGSEAPDKGAVILIGTWDFPICIDGDVVFESDVIIRGFVSGRGTIYSGRNIHVIGDINYKDPPYWPDTGSEPETKGKDMLYLISRGSIVFGNYAKYGTTSMDAQWSGTDSLLSGNYINGRANTSDTRSKWGKDNAAVPYVEMDYTQNDTKGWAKYKLVYNKTTQTFERTQVKYYESVVGDYVFISKNDSSNTKPDESGSLTSYGSSCRFAQTWDCNLGGVSSLKTKENFFRYLPYQSKFIEAFAKHKGWKSVDRAGTSAKTMTRLWNEDQSDIWNFYTTAQSDGYGGYSTGYSGGYSGTYSGNSQKPCMTEIQDINAVLYSSMGIFGIVGGKNASVTINGAVICQDEALFPYTQYQAKRWGWWSWWGWWRSRAASSKTSQLALTINWDIRLNNKSTESRFNQEGEDRITPPVTTDVDDSGNANAPRILSWQEVPDSFNEEYHAKP